MAQRGELHRDVQQHQDGTASCRCWTRGEGPCAGRGGGDDDGDAWLAPLHADSSPAQPAAAPHQRHGASPRARIDERPGAQHAQLVVGRGRAVPQRLLRRARRARRHRAGAHRGWRPRGRRGCLWRARRARRRKDARAAAAAAAGLHARARGCTWPVLHARQHLGRPAGKQNLLPPGPGRNRGGAGSCGAVARSTASRVAPRHERREHQPAGGVRERLEHGEQPAECQFAERGSGLDAAAQLDGTDERAVGRG
jgi:hypothetical protein